MCSAAAPKVFSFLEHKASLTPSAARASATALPKPRLDAATRATRSRMPRSIRRCEASSSLLHVPVVAAFPVFAARDEDLQANGVFQGVSHVRHVGGNGNRFTGLDDLILAADIKANPSFPHCADLLVVMAVQRHLSALFHFEIGDRHAFAVDYAPREKRAELLPFDLFPAIVAHVSSSLSSIFPPVFAARNEGFVCGRAYCIMEKFVNWSVGESMKGVVLAGGTGSRLYPLTKITNKHLLPIYDKPMIYYPIETLVRAGIEDIMIVTGGSSAGDFLRLLGNGREFGLKDIYYTYQEGEGGIADALKLCEHFSEGQRVVVILGDNILEDDITPYVRKFEEQPSGARILLKEVDDPERFGCPQLDGDRIVRIEEKPIAPKSSYAVTGVYMYDGRVFDFCRRLKPSARGELEITDVNNAYVNEGDLYYDVLGGWWTDAGTFESLFRANELAARKRTKVAL